MRKMKSMQDMEENLILKSFRIILEANHGITERVNAADFKETVFNEYEKKNAEFLRQKEFAMHDGGYQLDQ